MTSDNLAALEEIKRTGMAYVNSIESLFRSNDVNVEGLATAYRLALDSIVIAERALKPESEKCAVECLIRKANDE